MTRIRTPRYLAFLLLVLAVAPLTACGGGGDDHAGHDHSGGDGHDHPKDEAK